MSFVLLWQPSECLDLFVTDYIFVSFLENKYDNDDDELKKVALHSPVSYAPSITADLILKDCNSKLTKLNKQEGKWFPYIVPGMWSRSRRLGLETVSRRTNVSSRSRLGLGPKGLGVSSRVSDLFVSSRRFIQARHAKLQFSDTSHALVRSSWLILSNNVDRDWRLTITFAI